MNTWVIVCARNEPGALARCLGSLAAQTVPSRVICVDDASDDGRVWPLIVEARSRGVVERAVRNVARRGATANLWLALEYVGVHGPDDVIVLVDGDDWLPHEHALARIIEPFHRADSPDVWVAFGSYVPDPESDTCHPAEPYPPEVLEARSFRSHSHNLFNHPLAFRADLAAQLDLEDVTLADGRFVPGIYDEALMYPLLEMAAPDHVHFNPEPLYVYNTANPASVWRDPATVEDARAAAAELRARPPLPRLARQDGGLFLPDPADRARIIVDYLRRWGLGTVVETGTGAGDLCAALLTYPEVERVVTVEADPEVAAAARARFDGERVDVIEGHSPDVLLDLVAVERAGVVWWLDAHRDNWWEGEEASVCPLLDELAVLRARPRGDVVLIDDARLLGRARGYPTFPEVRVAVGGPVRVRFDIVRCEPTVPAGG